MSRRFWGISLHPYCPACILREGSSSSELSDPIRENCDSGINSKNELNNSDSKTVNANVFVLVFKKKCPMIKVEFSFPSAQQRVNVSRRNYLYVLP